MIIVPSPFPFLAPFQSCFLPALCPTHHTDCPYPQFCAITPHYGLLTMYLLEYSGVLGVLAKNGYSKNSERIQLLDSYLSAYNIRLLISKVASQYFCVFLSHHICGALSHRTRAVMHSSLEDKD